MEEGWEETKKGDEMSSKGKWLCSLYRNSGSKGKRLCVKAIGFEDIVAFDSSTAKLIQMMRKMHEEWKMKRREERKAKRKNSTFLSPSSEAASSSSSLLMGEDDEANEEQQEEEMDYQKLMMLSSNPSLIGECDSELAAMNEKEEGHFAILRAANWIADAVSKGKIITICERKDKILKSGLLVIF
ncbi:uncharacterized protein MONOS_13411 [Monocercomonoides exilis]|uniref:uncharacterized protein n=1 Tax=Monocercomonoides exilis TaxID=2049356 RepID=UPI00355A6355|nr:hypothetical protein MONOS_13411 [Monocercomonoides exilis]|eukprot:MONOS_13411.1-p1 / transcript=MONOS_13411.1 / gene=MONOS_13411 / organism=Monocercomonoides_exilis_PA203 / gene_product=unspecified product / transcript_product=unspecified product / location=Mono_scaffold00824:7090-7748(-) / protein_length=185 / sequence_SO=supercontig / SO=protein_coding / is_pseudo=false